MKEPSRLKKWLFKGRIEKKNKEAQRINDLAAEYNEGKVLGKVLKPVE